MTEQATVSVTLTVDGSVDEMVNLFTAWLVSRDMPLESDYSRLAWGGWSGPFVVAVEVAHPDGTIESTSEGWGTRHA